MSFVKKQTMLRTIPSMGDTYLHKPRGTTTLLAGLSGMPGDCGCGCKGKGTCGQPARATRGGITTGIPGPFGLGSLGEEAPPPPDLNAMVADIRATADRYVKQDRQLRYMQVGATLLIPLAALVTKAILHLRRGDPIL